MMETIWKPPFFFSQPLTPKNQGAPATAAKLLGPAIVVLRCTADPPGGQVKSMGKYDFVSWDDDIPIWKNKNHVLKHQPTCDLCFFWYCDVFIGRLVDLVGFWICLVMYCEIFRSRILGIQLKQVAQTKETYDTYGCWKKHDVDDGPLHELQCDYILCIYIYMYVSIYIYVLYVYIYIYVYI